MPKLFTLGCSLTYGYGWKDYLVEKTGFELVNSAMYGGSNDLQVKRIHSYVVNNQINEDDIIIWQITSQMRCSFSLAPCDTWQYLLDDVEPHPDPRFANRQFYIDAPTNYFSKKEHIDVLPSHPITEKAANYYDFAQSLEELLSTIILLNKTYKILVFVGWDGALDEIMSNYDRFILSLNNNKVPNLSQSYLDWVIKNRMPLDPEDPTGLHPAMESSETYAETVLYPKLQELGWIQ